VLFIIASTSDIGIGFRHLLPIFPILYILIGLITALTRDKRLSTLVPLFTRGMGLELVGSTPKSKKGIYLK
jgi:hypothetical protein